MASAEYKKYMALGNSLYKRGLYRRASNAFSSAACVYFINEDAPETFTDWREAVRMQRKSLTLAAKARNDWLATTYGAGRFLDPECPLAGRLIV